MVGTGQAELGTAIAVGDVNDDGYADSIAGDGNDAYVYVSAGASGPPTTATSSLTGPPLINGMPSSAFGCAVSGLDVNGDGFADVTVGANNDATGAGTVSVFRSACAGGAAAAAASAATSTIRPPSGASQLGTVLAP